MILLIVVAAILLSNSRTEPQSAIISPTPDSMINEDPTPTAVEISPTITSTLSPTVSPTTSVDISPVE